MSTELLRRKLRRQIEKAQDRLEVIPYGPEGEALNDRIGAMLNELYVLEVAAKTGKAA